MFNSLKNFLKNNYDMVISLVAFLATTLLGVFQFGMASLDLDEFFSLDYVNSLTKITNLFNQDTGNPPLFTLLTHPWALIFGQNELTIRLLPFLFYALAALVFYKLLTLLSLAKIEKTILMLAFFGMSQFYYLRYFLRPYSLLLLSCVLTVYLTFKLIILCEKSARNLLRKKEITIVSLELVLSFIFGLTNHYIYILFVLMIILALVIAYFQKNLQEYKIKYLVRTYSVALFLIGLVFWNLISRPVSYAFGQRFLAWPNYSGWLYLLTKFSFWGNLPDWLSLIVWIFIFVYSLLGAQKLPLLKKIIVYLANLIFLVYFFSPLHTLLTHAKYFSFIVPFFYLSLYFVFGHLFSTSRRKLILLMLLIPWISLVRTPFRLELIEDWRGAVSYYRARCRNQEKIVVSDNIYYLAINYYLKKQNLPSTEILSIQDPKSGVYIPLPAMNENLNNFVYINRWSLSQTNVFGNYLLIKKKDFENIVLGHFTRPLF